MNTQANENESYLETRSARRATLKTPLEFPRERRGKAKR